MIAAGAPEDVIASVRSEAGGSSADQFEVWPENLLPLDVFLLLTTCWTWVSTGLPQPVRLGIPAPEIESTIRLLGVAKKRRAQLFLDVRLLESAALEVMYG